MKNTIKRSFFIISVIANCLLQSSCSPELWMGVAEGLMGIPSYGMYNTSYPTSYGSSSYGSYGSSSSSYSSSSSKCSRCNGTRNCKTCGGSGKVYDYGPASVISKEKYTHNCGVCNGTGRCGVCDGKGYIK